MKNNAYHIAHINVFLLILYSNAEKNPLVTNNNK